MPNVGITMLNSMASGDFAESLDIQKNWNVTQVDLKDAILGKGLLDLTMEEAEQANAMVLERGLSVYCLSSGLFYDDIEKGEEAYAAANLARVPELIALAKVFNPGVVRLLSARSSKRKEIPDMRAYIPESHPWLLPLYREAIDRITGAGIRVTIENEVHGCILGNPDEIVWFFDALERPGLVSFTCDPGNLWQEGVFPTREIFDRFLPYIGYLHLKGGLPCDGSQSFCWQGSLEDSPWPVAEIAKAYVESGSAEAICLNPPHGKPKPGVDYTNLVHRDLEFVRRNVPGAV